MPPSHDEQSCFVTTKTGDLRDDACGEGRAGGEGSFIVDAVVGFTFGVDDGSGLGGAGAQVGGMDMLAGTVSGKSSAILTSAAFGGEYDPSRFPGTHQTLRMVNGTENY